jgi:2-polyprenyl-3-methyl-5-hydroxy-6-metoxy-1,4-benzoquinol methylase
MNLKSTYDRIAEDWHRDHLKDDWWIEGTDAFASFLKPGATILDVGCGAGLKSHYLMQKGFKVTGIDFSEKMIELAKREVPAGTFYVMDMNDMNHLPGTFDAVFAQAVLLHVPKEKIRGVVRSLAEKINDGGYLYVAVKRQRENEPDESILVENDYGYAYERFFSYFTMVEMESYLKNLGLEICYENNDANGKKTWIQIIGKKK